MTTVSFVALQISAWFHLLQLPGTWYLARHVVGLQHELRKLDPLARAIIAVLGTSVVVVLVALGVLLGTHAHEVLGSRLGLRLCLGLALFWAVRLTVQYWYYRYLPWPRSTAGRVAHWLLSGVIGVKSGGLLIAWFLRTAGFDAG